MIQGSVIHHFANGRATNADRDLLGNKGANLADMTRAGLPVPPGFTITTAVCRAYLAKRKFPRGFEAELDAAMRRLERSTKKRFGDPRRPLLVAVRSGASVSMPGMMDTVLNVGLTDAIVEQLAIDSGDVRFAHDSYRRLIATFGHVVHGVPRRAFADAYLAAQRTAGAATEAELDDADFPDVVARTLAAYRKAVGKPFPQDPREQLARTIRAVFESWTSPRAVAYRKSQRLDDVAGTAVTVQSMAFGNLGDDSATGVAFTRDPSTGENRFYGEFLVNAQGEDIVGGTRTPHDCEREMRLWSRRSWRELRALKTKLETRYGDAQDFEFTIERGELFVLQTRTAKRTARAAVKIASDLVRAKLIDERAALLRVDPLSLDQLLQPAVDAARASTPLARGLPSSPGVAIGTLAFTAADAARRGRAGERVILVRHETDPDDFAGMLASVGVLTRTGGMTSHAAVVARALGRPCVVGAASIAIDGSTLTIDGRPIGRDDTLSIDGTTGDVFAGAVPTVDADLRGPFATIMRLADRHRTLRVLALVKSAADRALAKRLRADGIVEDGAVDESSAVERVKRAIEKGATSVVVLPTQIPAARLAAAQARVL